MIRLIGGLLITAATAAWGIMGVMRLRARAGSFHALSSALGMMGSEICDRLTPMPELLQHMADEAAYPASQLFKNALNDISSLGSRSFAAIWQQAVRSTPELMLQPSEALVLTELGQSLGRYDIAEQKSAIQYAQRRMEDFARAAEAERDNNSKVRAFLGVAAGLFTVIILF
jgi:stage III sporulation protein AB